MKVSNSNVNNNSALGVNQTQQAEAASQSSRVKAGGSPESGADRVHMSSLAGVLGGEASSRAERVDQLADAVQSGRYRVDAKAVSHAIVNSALNEAE